MRRFALVCLFLSLGTAPAAGQDLPQRTGPTLTAGEIKDGWISLFDGETTFGWETYYSSTKRQAQVVNGALDMRGLGHASIVHTSKFHAFELHLEYQSAFDNAFIGLGHPEDMHKIATAVPKRMQWTPLKMRVIDKKLEWEYEDGLKRTQPWQGRSVLVCSSGPRNELKLRNIKLRPIKMKTLFNGKDLTGWKVIPGKKSTFTVVDGAINVKDGPGDLQSEGKFGDFLLQLECISNGKHLNSGVFFRCRPNEYQNGYEAQVRNEFTAKPTQKYLVEEYDPKTHKLLGKKEVFSTAVDFGTGAIYRRQPARKEMSKDGEWFTMTIVAHGNHFATWVNGMQVVDWTDHRPPSDNARNGYRREAGHISFQGHDPTTDLSFRNIRIQEYPATHAK